MYVKTVTGMDDIFNNVFISIGKSISYSAGAVERKHPMYAMCIYSIRKNSRQKIIKIKYKSVNIQLRLMFDTAKISTTWGRPLGKSKYSRLLLRTLQHRQPSASPVQSYILTTYIPLVVVAVMLAKCPRLPANRNHIVYGEKFP